MTRNAANVAGSGFLAFHYPALRMRIQAVGPLALNALPAHSLGRIIVNFTPLWVNKKAALSLALPPEAANCAVWVLVNATAGGVRVRALRVFARAAVLALNAAGALPRKLFACVIRR